MSVNWELHARRLADQVSRWHEPIAATPRHLFVPRWWDESDDDTWTLRDGPFDEETWLRVAYSDETLITSVAGQHADHAQAGDQPSGLPTSSSTLPSVVVRMYRHANLYPAADVLDVGTGSGYGCALLCARLGDQRVTSIDVDPYLTRAAAERLDATGLHPRVETVDATGPVPGEYDRIVSMVSVRPIPANWIKALKVGGRLVTTITNMSVIITAVKGDDGWTEGRVEWDRAMFMPTRRTGTAYQPSVLEAMLPRMRDQDAEQSQSPHPVLNVDDAWELSSMLELHAPNIEHYYRESDDGTRTAWMLHADGSWARATAHGFDPPIVHQGGPRRLWDILDTLREDWLRYGQLPLYGAWVFIPPEGDKIHLARGGWEATIS